MEQPMTQWEYKVISSDKVQKSGGVFTGKSTDDIETYLNDLARDNWEIVSLDFSDVKTVFFGVARRAVAANAIRMAGRAANATLPADGIEEPFEANVPPSGSGVAAADLFRPAAEGTGLRASVADGDGARFNVWVEGETLEVERPPADGIRRVVSSMTLASSEAEGVVSAVRALVSQIGDLVEPDETTDDRASDHAENGAEDADNQNSEAGASSETS